MKVVLALVASVALVLSLGTGAMAQVGLEVHGLYAFSFDDNSGAWEGDPTFGGGASVVYKLGDLVRFDLGFDYLRPQETDNSNSKAQLIPVTGTVRVGAPIEDMAFLYFGGGLGYSFNSWDGPASGDFDLKNCFTYHACLGGELFFNENLGLRAEFRYVWLDTESEFKASSQKNDVKFNHIQVRGGLIYYF